MTAKLKLFLSRLVRLSSRVRAKLARKLAALARGATKLLAGGVPGKLGYRLCQIAIAMAMAAGIAGGLSSTAHAITGTNQISQNNQDSWQPSVAKDTDGDSVVVWTSYDSSSSGIFFRRISANNQNASSPLPVNTTQANAQYESHVAIDSDGDFVVVWAGYGYSYSSVSSSQYDGEGIFAQRFNADGVRQGGQFRVNTTTAYGQFDPRVAMDADGNFVVVWESAQSSFSSDFSVIGRRFNADGTAASGEFTINQAGNGYSVNPDIAMDLSGDFVVVWQSDASTSYSSSLYYSGDEIYGRRYDNTGTAQGNQFRVNQAGTFDQRNPAVAMDADGDFVVAWTNRYNYFSRWISFGTFDNTGALASGDSPAQDGSADWADFADVAMDADGNFVVAWQGYSSFSSSWAVQAQFFNADGTDFISEFNAENWQGTFVGTPSVALDSDGDYVIAYTDDNGSYYVSGYFNNVYDYSSSLFGSTGASPRVGNVFVSNDHHRIEDGERLAQDNITTLVVTFSEAMDKATVEDTGNWTLTRDGAPVAISSVFYSFHILRNRREALVTLAAPLGDGAYVLTLSDTMLDDNDGAQLDGDNDGAATGSFVLNFSVNAAERSGGEVRVNTVTAENQYNADVAMDDSGNYVVVWQSYRYDSSVSSSTWDILAQRYTAGGAAAGGVITVNSLATGDQTNPSVAMDADGNFVVAWQTDVYGSNYISAQMFYSDGTTNGGNFTIAGNFYGARTPDVAMDNDGDFVVAWNENFPYGGPSSSYDWDILGATFDRFGNYVGGGVLNQNTRSHDQSQPAVAIDADGDFVAVWTDESLSFYFGPAPAIMGWRMDRHGNQLEGGFGGGGEFPIAIGQAPFFDIPFQPDVAMDDDGDFVVTWASAGYAFSYYGYGPQFAISVKAARFNSNGVPFGAIFGGEVVNTDGRVAAAPAIAMDGDGDYVITWSGTDGYTYASGPSSIIPLRSEVYARRFNAEGAAQENQIKVNTFVSGQQLFSSAAMDADGDYVIVWQSGPSYYSPSANQDGDGFGIYQQRFDQNTAPTTSGIPDQMVDEDSDPFVINLGSFFADNEDPDAELTFSIVGNTNPGLVGVGVAGTQLGIALFEDQFGTADITIRCTDTGGLWVEDTFTLTVTDVGEFVPPKSKSDDDGCAASTSAAAPWGLLAVLMMLLGSLRGLVRRKS